MTAVRRSIAVSVVGNYAGLALQVISTVIIARLLTPAELGVFAVSAALAALASTFRDFGIAEYLIQEKQVDRETLRAAFGVNILMSWSMALLMFASAPAVSEFFKTPGVCDVMQVQALSFLLIPFGAVTMAWFRREMNFRPIIVTDLAGQVMSFGLSIWLALKGFGYMSLAWASLAGVAVTVVSAVYLRPAELPRWPSLRGARRVFEFGRYASGIYILGQAGKSAPELMVGRAMDMVSVGMISRAEGFVEVFHRLVLRAVMPICLPYFAASVRDGGHLQPAFLQMTGYLTAIGWTAFGALALTARPLMEILYGDQWLDAVVLAQLLCAAAALELLYFPSKEALLALGRARRAHWLQVLIQGIRVLGLLAVFWYGLVGACIGLLVAAAVGAGLAFAFLAQAGQLGWAALLRVLTHSAVVATVALVPGLGIVLLFPFGDDTFFGTAAGCWIAITAAWLLALWLTRHPLLREMRQFAQMVAARHRPDGG